MIKAAVINLNEYKTELDFYFQSYQQLCDIVPLPLSSLTI